MQILYQSPTPSFLPRKNNSLMASSSLIFRRKGSEIIPFHRIKAGLPVCTETSELQRAGSCCLKHSRGMQGGSKGSSQIGGVPWGHHRACCRAAYRCTPGSWRLWGEEWALPGRQVTGFDSYLRDKLCNLGFIMSSP